MNVQSNILNTEISYLQVFKIEYSADILKFDTKYKFTKKLVN